MSLNSLDHCSIRTVKLQQTRDFYVDMLGCMTGIVRSFRSRETGCMSMAMRSSIWSGLTPMIRRV